MDGFTFLETAVILSVIVYGITLALPKSNSNNKNISKDYSTDFLRF
ncbi:hypothetical protein [Caloranaerobacter ferrireducens]|nr:hypothetical protein [Caloranaerobacter ferrireducens]